MSSAKFAAITASLLARKGDAAPSVVVPVVVPVVTPPRPARVRRDNQPLPSEPRPQDSAEKPRRVMVTITPEELERLNIAAVKKGTSRHDIVRGALDDYFRKLSAELPHPCACMEGHPAIAARHSEFKPSAAQATPPNCAEEPVSPILTDKVRQETGRDVMAL